jgi:hypothetical protein
MSSHNISNFSHSSCKINKSKAENSRGNVVQKLQLPELLIQTANIRKKDKVYKESSIQKVEDDGIEQLR